MQTFVAENTTKWRQKWERRDTWCAALLLWLHLRLTNRTVSYFYCNQSVMAHAENHDRWRLWPVVCGEFLFQTSACRARQEGCCRMSVYLVEFFSGLPQTKHLLLIGGCCALSRKLKFERKSDVRNTSVQEEHTSIKILSSQTMRRCLHWHAVNSLQPCLIAFLSLRQFDLVPSQTQEEAKQCCDQKDQHWALQSRITHNTLTQNWSMNCQSGETESGFTVTSKANLLTQDLPAFSFNKLASAVMSFTFRLISCCITKMATGPSLPNGV